MMLSLSLSLSVSQKVIAGGHNELQSSAGDLLVSLCSTRQYWTAWMTHKDTGILCTEWRNIKQYMCLTSCTVKTFYYLRHTHACSLLVTRAACWMSHYLLERLLFMLLLFFFITLTMRVYVFAGSYCKLLLGLNFVVNACMFRYVHTEAYIYVQTL